MKTIPRNNLDLLKNKQNPYYGIYEMVSVDVVQLLLHARYLVEDQDAGEKLKLLYEFYTAVRDDKPDFNKFDSEAGGFGIPKDSDPVLLVIGSLLFEYLDNGGTFFDYQLSLSQQKKENGNRLYQNYSYSLLDYQQNGLQGLASNNPQLYGLAPIDAEKRQGYKHWHLLKALISPAEMIDNLLKFEDISFSQIFIDVIDNLDGEKSPELNNLIQLTKSYATESTVKWRSITQAYKNLDTQDKEQFSALMDKVDLRFIEKTSKWLNLMIVSTGNTPTICKAAWYFKTEDQGFMGKKYTSITIDQDNLKTHLKYGQLDAALETLKHELLQAYNSNPEKDLENLQGSEATYQEEANSKRSNLLDTLSWWEHKKGISLFNDPKFSLNSAIRGVLCYDLCNPQDGRVKISTTEAAETIHKQIADMPANERQKYVTIRNRPTEKTTDTVPPSTIKRDYYAVVHRISIDKEGDLPLVRNTVAKLIELNEKVQFPRREGLMQPFWLPR